MNNIHLQFSKAVCRLGVAGEPGETPKRRYPELGGSFGTIRYDVNKIVYPFTIFAGKFASAVFLPGGLGQYSSPVRLPLSPFHAARVGRALGRSPLPLKPLRALFEKRQNTTNGWKKNFGEKKNRKKIKKKLKTMMLEEANRFAKE